MQNDIQHQICEDASSNQSMENNKFDDGSHRSMYYSYIYIDKLVARSILHHL